MLKNKTGWKLVNDLHFWARLTKAASRAVAFLAVDWRAQCGQGLCRAGMGSGPGAQVALSEDVLSCRLSLHHESIPVRQIDTETE